MIRNSFNSLGNFVEGFWEQWGMGNGYNSIIDLFICFLFIWDCWVFIDVRWGICYFEFIMWIGDMGSLVNGYCI
jgi:hypothetical protein